MGTQHDDFERFWLHFVRSHTQPGTRWMHTAGVMIFCLGALLAISRASLGPLLLAGALFLGLAVFAHPLFEGNWPENTRQPLYGVLANFRMAWHTLRGTMDRELARARAE